MVTTLLLAAAFALVENGRPVAAFDTLPAGAVSDVALFNRRLREVTGTALPVDGRAVRRIGVTLERPSDLSRRFDWAIRFADKDRMEITATARSLMAALVSLLEEGCDARFLGTEKCMFQFEPRRDVSVAVRARRSAERCYTLNRDVFVVPGHRRELGLAEDGAFRYTHGIPVYAFPKAKYDKEGWPAAVMPTLKDGTRLEKPPARAFVGWQPCYSSPETGRIATENVLAYLRSSPQASSVTLGVNDGRGYCACARCRAMNAKGGRSLFTNNPMTVSESYYTFANTVAAAVADAFPGVRIGLLAYTGTIMPPTFPVVSTIVPMMTFDLYAAAPDPATLAKQEDVIRRWGAKTRETGTWSYEWGRGYLMPRVDFAAQAHRLKFLHANGGRAYFGEAMLDALEGPKIYLLSKLLADIDRDPEALLDEWYGRFAGKAAAAPLRELYDRVTAYWRSPKMKATPYWSQRGYVYLDPTAARQKGHLAGLEPGFTRGLLALADRVRASAVTPGERRRADVLVRHFELLDAAAAFLGYAYCDPRTQAPADAAAAASMLEELAARAPELLTRFARAKAYFRQPDFDDPDLYADAYLPAGMNRFLAGQFAAAGRYVADGRVAAAFGRIARTETLPASFRTLAASVAAASRGEAPDVFAGGFTSALRAPDVRTSLPYAVSDEIRFDGARTLLLRPGDPDGGVPNPYDTALKNIAAFFVDRAVEPGFYIADVSLYSRAKGVRTADTVLWRQADGHALDWSAFARTDLPPGTWRSFRTVCFVDDNSDGVRLGVRLGGFRPGETVFVGGVRLVKAAAPDASARRGRVPASRLQRRGAVPETVDGTRALVYRPSRRKLTLFAQAFAPKKGSVRIRAGESFRATVRCRSLDPARPARVTARLSVWRNGSYEAIGNLFRAREAAAGVFADIVGDIPAAAIDGGAAGAYRLLVNVFADASSGPVAVERIDWRIVSSR